VDDAVLDEFRGFLESKEFEFAAEDFEAAREELTLRLRAQIARIKWDQREEARIRAEGDPVIQRALELFDEAATLRQQADSMQSGGDTSPL